jgi:hypothetical protein
VRKRKVVFDEDSSEEDRSEDDVAKLPVREARHSKKRLPSLSESSEASPTKDNSDEDEDDDDKPLVTPTPRRKRRMIADESDEDGEPLISSPVKRRRLVRRNEDSSPTKQAKDDENDDEEPAPSSVRSRRTGRKPLTQKERARELLRRKRAGEVINEEEEPSSSGEEEPAKAMYDTDSDHLALNEFEDDEEGVVGPAENGKKAQKKSKGKQKTVVNSDGESESMDDFVVEDDDDLLGAPEDMDMPLEFTAHSHKPLKEHFRDAIEWLVQFKINPGFAEKTHALYRMAWKKLDDEVRALATSKFASAAWKKDFYMALRARPYFTNVELPKGDLLEARSCGACGRSGHPAR